MLDIPVSNSVNERLIGNHINVIEKSKRYSRRVIIMIWTTETLK